MTTRYSEKIPGSDSNYNWPVTFDMSHGHLRLVQPREDAEGEVDTNIVLLCPRQVKALLKFLGAERRKR